MCMTSDAPGPCCRQYTFQCDCIMHPIRAAPLQEAEVVEKKESHGKCKQVCFSQFNVLNSSPTARKKCVCVCVCVCARTPTHACTLSHAWLFATSWTVARQPPLPMKFSRGEYGSWLPFPISQDLPYAGIKPMSLASPTLAGRFFTTSTTWEALRTQKHVIYWGPQSLEPTK